LGRSPGTVNAPIKIQHGSGTRTVIERFDVYPGSSPATDPRTVGIISIQGDSGFNSGPAIGNRLNTADPYIRSTVNGDEVIPSVATFNDIPDLLVFNQTYAELVFGSENFPRNTSGTVGAILVGGGTNGELHGVIQSRIFAPVPVPVPPDPVLTPDTSQSIDAQTVQRQLITQSQVGACVEIAPVATNRDRASVSQPSPCTTPADDSQILKILNQ
jgi:hypothetical protein